MTGRIRRGFRRAAAGLAVFWLAGCDLAPPYHGPGGVAVPARYKDGGIWSPSAPADRESRGAWWRVFRDPTLDALEARLLRGNATLAEAVARRDAALGALRTAASALYPQVDLGANATRGHSLFFGDEHDAAGGPGLTYEVDLWGAVANSVRAARDEARATREDLASVQLSLSAQLAEAYFSLRGADADLALLRETETAYRAAEDLTRKLYAGGAASEIDLDRAETQAADAAAQRGEAEAARAQYENAIADLLGENAAGFHLASMTLAGVPPAVPVGTPSTLLQRRPDIAAAERRVTMANARVGIARAALYPSLTLSASAVYEAVWGTMLHATEFVWALGPGVVNMPLFDAGRREGQVDQSLAALRGAAAAYRQTVLDAFRDVADQMALANRLADAATAEDRAAEAADRALALALVQYKDGAVDYLQVVVAQTADLTARSQVIDLRRRRYLAAVDLVRALGGGWQAADSG